MSTIAAIDAREVRTTCPYCGVGCGVLAKVAANGAVSVRGDPDHPANRGKLCSKGSALGETTGIASRVLHPEIAGKSAGWDAALDLVAGKFRETIERHGPDSVAFYISGQLLTEDYYVANKLMKGFIGSANVDTNSRLCMASSVAGHKRAFGEDIVPGIYEDLELADLVVLTGSNTAWCHPVLYQRLMTERRKRGVKVVVIDPRRTATADECDLHLAIAPSADVLLFNGLLAYLASTGGLDEPYIAAHTSGFDLAVAVAAADAPSIKRVTEGCGLTPADVRAFFELFAANGKAVTVYSQGVNQSAHGTDKVNAIINCHLATGRIGKPGMGPFSVTGQPNAMGGREVGGLANQLAAHMGFENSADIERVSHFWNAPNIARRPGLKAVDLFEAAADGRVKALWVMGTNPAVSMPNSGRVHAALKNCFLVVSDVTRTDTSRFADIFLPAATWGEKDGTVTNSERCISRQRPFLPLPGEARPDWRIVCDLATRMGFGQAFAYGSVAEIFREHSALSALDNDGDRLFDIGALSTIDAGLFETFPAQRWPLRKDAGETGGRLLGDGRFPTPDGRARFIAVRHEGVAAGVDANYPIALNTGRLRDQWHTMTRTGNVPRLMANAPEPLLDLNPADAVSLNIADGDLACVTTRHGFARARVRTTDAQRPGEAFLPMHWSRNFAASAVAGMVSSPVADAFSGQPELKHAPARITRETVAWAGLLITRRDLRPTGFVHWSRSAVDGGWVYDFRGTETPDQGILLTRRLLDIHRSDDLLEYKDRRGLTYRAAAVDEAGRLADALLVGPPDQLPGREWLLSLLASDGPLIQQDRLTLLSGRAAASRPSVGRIVCSCFNIGVNQLAMAVASGCGTVEEIGAVLRAGTNCGSCRSEIRTIIDAGRIQAAE